MDTRNPKDMSTHSNAFHEQQLALFDAYVTGELDEDERAQVEQHLKSCPECQQLFAEVTHFRHLLAMLSETRNVSGTERERTHSSLMIQAVMTSIEQGKKTRNILQHMLRTNLKHLHVHQIHLLLLLSRESVPGPSIAVLRWLYSVYSWLSVLSSLFQHH